MNRTRALVVGAFLSLAAPLAAPTESAAGPEIRIASGDRVVFFGDSITEQRMYTRYIQQYVYVRHPEWDVRFFNAGWGGDTATGALERLERDVLYLKPTLVTLFFGMNDGGYKVEDAPTVATYRASMTGLVKTLLAKGVRVVVFTPGCVDPDRNRNFESVHYLDALETLAKTALDVAKEQGVPGVDLFHPMLTFQTERKRADPTFTMLPDGVHPNAAGHLVMAKAMLEGLGLEPFPPLGRIDLASGKGDAIALTTKSENELTLTTTSPPATPFWIEAGSIDVARDGRLLDQLAGQRLQVIGMPEGAWELTVDGTAAGKFTGADLGRGIGVPGTWSADGKNVHDLVARKENAYFSAWREVRLALAGLAGLDRVLDGLMTADLGFHEMIRARPVAVRAATLVFVRAPAGDNLAARKPCVSSDPNTWGWGAAGLTDGRWDADSGHCFATGASPQFPKTVTIDLERAQRIALVRLGCPEFGSTRTVAISESIDGKKYREVGRVEFGQRRAERKTVTFEAKTARYVRLTYVDHYPQAVGPYSENFAFTTEVEVYGSQK